MFYVSNIYYKPNCGPRISHDAFPLDNETRFLFIWWKIWFFLEKIWSRHLFLFYFFKGKTK